MDQKRIKAISLLILFQNVASLHAKDIIPKEDAIIIIQCAPSKAGALSVAWFRLVDNGMEFIGSFRTTGELREESQMSHKFDQLIYSDKKMKEDQLYIRKYNSQRDSGVYGCAALNASALTFGEVTRLLRDVPAIPSPAGPATKASRPTSAACTCKNIKTEEDKALSIWSCSPVILGSLACGYGVIILLFVITIIYCNRIRTRRCPHHYKRQKQRRRLEGGHAVEN